VAPSPEIVANVEAIKSSYAGNFPKTVLVLGSGLGSFGEDIDVDGIIPYTEIPHFPQPSVEGHAGRLIIGRAGGGSVACMQGRMHVYEGHSPAALAIPVRTFRALDVDTIILTNAAGSLHADMGPGSLMMIEDHINFGGNNPLIGPNDPEIGPRFPDMTEAYDKDLRTLMMSTAEELGIKLFKGVYMHLSGPNFETPAEIRMFGRMGADAVGMSTVPECLVARHCGMRVAGMSLITNLAAGMSDTELTHEETMSEAQKAEKDISRLMKAFISRIPPVTAGA